ncbi:MAG: hypothetical protein ACO3GP_01395 [Candidatus Limnocylindrus sp.]
MPFFSQDFTASLAPKESTENSREQFINPGDLGKTLPNPLRLSILSPEPLTGYEIWFDKAAGGSTNLLHPGAAPTEAHLAEYEKATGHTVAFEKDFDTKQPTDRKAVRKCAAFFVYDYEAKMVKLLKYTQISLMREIDRKTGDPDYADLTKWDMEISKIQGPKISYGADMKPALRAKDKAIEKELTEAWAKAQADGYDLMALTEGKWPFGSK